MPTTCKNPSGTMPTAVPLERRRLGQGARSAQRARRGVRLLRAGRGQGLRRDGGHDGRGRQGRGLPHVRLLSGALVRPGGGATRGQHDALRPPAEARLLGEEGGRLQGARRAGAVAGGSAARGGGAVRLVLRPLHAVQDHLHGLAPAAQRRAGRRRAPQPQHEAPPPPALPGLRGRPGAVHHQSCWLAGTAPQLPEGRAPPWKTQRGSPSSQGTSRLQAVEAKAACSRRL
ncbi:hypothetical protein ON010_g5192 [Phytophthora cinnamomi]|nr:hypothetical protein ON010_g5192 [Phytophthora cinnamomi]